MDPACGTEGFLVLANEILCLHHPQVMRDDALREHFNHHMFHGFDFDSTMLRIGSMTMALDEVENPDGRAAACRRAAAAGTGETIGSETPFQANEPPVRG